MNARHPLRCLASLFVLGTVLACLATARPAPAVEASALAAARASIVTGELKEHVNVLADDPFEGREAGSRGGRAAAAYLVQKLQAYRLKGMGDEGGYFQNFDGMRNILVMLEGSDPKLKQEVIVISAHYDHVGYGTPRNSYGPIGYIHRGADDNASGVSGLLSLIEALSKLPTAPRRSILFAFWDGEEKGLLGSKYWVAHPTLPLKQVAMMVNMDMIGRLRDSGVEVIGSRTAHGLRQLVSRVNDDLTLPIEFVWDLKEDSDHWSFLVKEMPVLMLHTGLHGDYHRPSDTADKLNIDGMQAVSRLLFNLTIALSEAETLSAFRPVARTESHLQQQALERVSLPASPPRLGVSWDKATNDEPGCILKQLTPGGAAERAGLQAGDRVLMIGGYLLRTDEDFRTAVVTAPSIAPIVVQRDPAAEAETILVPLAGEGVRLGVTWREDEAEPGTLLVSGVIPGSPAARAGIIALDRIYEVGGRRLVGGEDFQTQLATASGRLPILLERTGRCFTINVELPSR